MTLALSKLKILMVNYEFPPIGGGAGKAHQCILKEYTRKPELQIDVLTSAPKPGFVQEKFAENITIHKVGLHKKKLHFWKKSEVIEWLIKARRVYKRLLDFRAATCATKQGNRYRTSFRLEAQMFRDKTNDCSWSTRY